MKIKIKYFTSVDIEVNEGVFYDLHKIYIDNFNIVDDYIEFDKELPELYCEAKIFVFIFKISGKFYLGWDESGIGYINTSISINEQIPYALYILREMNVINNLKKIKDIIIENIIE